VTDQSPTAFATIASTPDERSWLKRNSGGTVRRLNQRNAADANPGR
jgi:hypothetical protein